MIRSGIQTAKPQSASTCPVCQSDMSCLTAFLLSLGLITEIHGLAPAALNPVINIPVSSNPSTLQLLNLSNTASDADLVNVTSGEVRCTGRQFGYNLNRVSCDEVWKKIPTDSDIFSFGARRAGTFERPLPYRYLSGKISPVYLVASLHLLLILLT